MEIKSSIYIYLQKTWPILISKCDRGSREAVIWVQSCTMICVSGTDRCSLLLLSAWFKNFKADSWWFCLDWSSVHCVAPAEGSCVLKKTIYRYKQSEGRILLTTCCFLFVLGLWFWGLNGFISLLPPLNWTRIDTIQRIDDSVRVPEPQDDSFHSVQPPKVRGNCLGKNLCLF